MNLKNAVNKYFFLNRNTDVDGTFIYRTIYISPGNGFTVCCGGGLVGGVNQV